MELNNSLWWPQLTSRSLIRHPKFNKVNNNNCECGSTEGTENQGAKQYLSRESQELLVDSPPVPDSGGKGIEREQL